MITGNEHRFFAAGSIQDLWKIIGASLSSAILVAVMMLALCSGTIW
jgi:hypothetical protein